MPLHRHQPCKAVAMETVPLPAQHLTAAGVGIHTGSLWTLSPERERSDLGVNGPQRLCLGYLVIRWQSCFRRLRQDLTGGVGPWRCACALWFLSTTRGRSLSIRCSFHHHVLPKHMEPDDCGLSPLTVSQNNSFFFRLLMPGILSAQVIKPVNVALRMYMDKSYFTFKNT